MPDASPLLVTTGDDVLVAHHRGSGWLQHLQTPMSLHTRIDFVIRELGWNLVRHAGGGSLRFAPVYDTDRNGLLIESRDFGRGINAMPRSDHPGPGLGMGLLAVQRNSNEFTMTTSLRGTRIRAVIWWHSTSL